MRILERLVGVPVGVVRWYPAKVRHVRREGGWNGWTLAELVCMTLSLLAVGGLVVLVVLRLRGVAVHPWVADVVVPVALAGAVGYLTNLVAITMLFRPYGPRDNHPAGLIPGWGRGLIARNRDELAAFAGKQVAENLLTAEAISAEVRELLQSALRSPDLRQRLTVLLGPIVRQRLPDIVESAIPEVMGILRGVLRRGATGERLRVLLDEVVEPWLSKPENQQLLADGLVAGLQEASPQIESALRSFAEEYKARAGRSARFAINAAEYLRILDWGEIRQVIIDKISAPQTRRQVVRELVPRVMARLRDALADGAHAPSVEALQARVSHHVTDFIEEYLKDELPRIGERLADNRRFWNWLADELTPSVAPYLERWLADDGVEMIRENFDVAGRVEAAVNGMSIEALHDAVNEGSAKHLGAIQVLGYVLGLAAGLCLLVV